MAYRPQIEVLLPRDPSHAAIAFPSISTGVYGFPADRAAEIAVAAVSEKIASDSVVLARVIRAAIVAGERV